MTLAKMLEMISLETSVVIGYEEQGTIWRAYFRDFDPEKQEQFLNSYGNRKVCSIRIEGDYSIQKNSYSPHLVLWLASE